MITPAPSKIGRDATPPRAALAVLALALLLGACVSTTAVSTYAASAGETLAELPSLSADYYASCLRRGALVAQSPPDRRVDTTAVRAGCVTAAQAAAALDGQQRVLTAYFAALAALADDKVIVADAEFEQFGAALARNPRIDPAQATAVTGITRLLTTSATDGVRRRALRRTILAQNANVQQLVRGIRTIVREDYRGTLGVEGRVLATIYRSALQVPGRAATPATALLVQERYAERSELLARRLRAATAYDDALRTVAEGHQRLTDARDRLGDAALRAWAVQHASALRASVRELQHAF